MLYRFLSTHTHTHTHTHTDAQKGYNEECYCL